jgi:hypothetical protein
MKEITRRLYTKPVMLSMAFLVGMALLVALFVTTKSTAAPTTFVAAGDDEFETTGNGETYHNFSASPIPANFFGPGSQQYTGVVPLVGVPINPGVSDVDTVIHRNQDVLVPGSTTLTMTALNLKSINPITVTYSGGGSETWNVQVNLSAFKASTGSMTINSTTFDSSLKVWPRFTFTRVGGGVPPKVLDTGGSGTTAASMSESSATLSDGVVFEPAPQPTLAPAPCRAVVIDEFEGHSKFNTSSTSAAAASGCAPVTLTSTGSPWQPCIGGGFCVPRPITEQELLASHNASPKGTKKQAQVAGE